MKRWAVFCLALLAFLAPVKFGTPVVLSTGLVPPQTIWEWLFFSWPNQLLPLFGCGALLWLVLDSRRAPVRVDGLFILPGLFLVTQLAALPTSICLATTTETVLHFAMCVGVFYVAAWYVRDRSAVAWIFGGLTVATVVIVIFAMEQHFGGLTATREYAAAYGENLPPDLRHRLTSNRVFSTLVYPNALAGFLVVAFAPVLIWIWSCRLRNWLKWGTLFLTGGLMVFALALTGSRGGFIAFAAMVITGLVAASRRAWLTLTAVAMIAGVFWVAQQAGLIRHGLASASARGDYWRGAVAIVSDHPWFGTGPGTFGSIYPKYKTAASEEAQLVHNNFLQMWSDSGVAAAVVFALLWLVAIWDGFKLARRSGGDVAGIAILAALTGWVVHGFLDFDLYVPGVAIPAFLLLGALQGLKTAPAARTRRQPKLALGTLCLAIGVVSVSLAGRSLLADFQNAPAGLESARRAMKLNPANPQYASIAGDWALRQGKASEAIDFYRVAVGNDPYRAAFHWRLARALWLVGDRPVEAIEQLKMATDLNPTKAQYRMELRTLEENIRQPEPGLLKSPQIEQER